MLSLQLQQRINRKNADTHAQGGPEIHVAGLACTQAVCLIHNQPSECMLLLTAASADPRGSVDKRLGHLPKLHFQSALAMILTTSVTINLQT